MDRRGRGSQRLRPLANGIEVFEDTNTGDLVYPRETGEISVVPELTSPAKGLTKAPKPTNQIHADANNGTRLPLREKPNQQHSVRHPHRVASTSAW